MTAAAQDVVPHGPHTALGDAWHGTRAVCYVVSMSEQHLPVVLRDGEDGWIVAECRMIPGCISQGRTRAEMVEVTVAA